jgi:hypothetical protein
MPGPDTATAEVPSREEAQMAAQRTSFEKLQRDRNKKAKAALKRERRQSNEDVPDVTEEVRPAVADDGGELSAAKLLELIEDIHNQLDAKTITFEEFEEKKADLMARLPID